ncbi:MAG: hydrogenase maturation protease [Gemmatimonadota bacterium]
MIDPASSPGASSATDLPDPARAVARATLYEGYVLWPYRRSALKNQRRWTFGGVHPRDWSDPDHPDDAWRMRAECLLENPGYGERTGEGVGARVHAAVRFLQVLQRRVARLEGGELVFVDEVEVGGERLLAWEEARERDVELPPLPVRPEAEVRSTISIAAASEREWLTDEDGVRRGAVVRSWRSLSGEVVARCEAVEGDAFRISAEVSNLTPWEGDGREDALRSTLVSSHFVFRAENADFVSSTAPPDELAAAAESCRNEGCWPVLVGERGSTDRILASPIILPDYPAIAPESPGDLFDGGEIDEMLALHIMTLTDEEKEEMRATDPRTREILDRTVNLGREELLRLHGTCRDEKTGDPIPEQAGDDRTDPTGDGRADGAGAADAPQAGLAEDAPDPFWVEMGRAPSSEIVMDGVTLRRGSRVRLHPSPGGDVMDIVLNGKVGIVEGIDEDDRGGVQFTVVVEDDPGLDLGMDRMPGHRFYFRPEEIEPLGSEASGDADRSDAENRAASSRSSGGILVACIGNIFLGDDGFGVEVARRLAGRRMPAGVTVEDFGIRGLDLAYALEKYDVVVFVDAVPRGGEPGTVYLIDASDEELAPSGIETHGMDPVTVLSFAQEVGPLPEEIYVIGCEPSVVPDPHGDVVVGGLSEEVEAAVDEAVRQVEALVAKLTGEREAKTPAPESAKQ